MKAFKLNKEEVKEGVYLIEGNDTYWQRKAVEFFVELVPEGYRSFNLRIIDSLKALSEVSEAINTVSMFFDVSTVIIVKDKDYKENAQDKEELNSILKADANCYVVFVNAAFISAANKKKLTVIDANKLETYELSSIITSIEPLIETSAVNLLMEYTSCDMDKISNELLKLKAYTEGKRRITENDVISLTANTVENDIFMLTEAIASGNKLKAYEILDRFMARGVPNMLIMGALTGLYRRMLHSLLSSKSDLELSKDLAVKEYAVKKTRSLAKRYTKRQLKACLDTLVDAEFSFKSGVSSEESSFKGAISKLMTVL